MSNGIHYTPPEDTIIRCHYPTSTWKEMLALLPGRPQGSIRVRASGLGIRKDKSCWEVGKPNDGPVLANLSEAERGYLAGLIDGEGCLRLSKSRNRNGAPVYHIQVDIANTSRALMDWLNTKLPGTVYGQDRQPRRTIYHWKLSGNRRAITFLREIAPYLIIKRAQADTLAGGYVHLSADERVALYERMAQLKRPA